MPVKRDSYYLYLTQNMSLELSVIQSRIKQLPESTNKEIALVKALELKTLIKDIQKEMTDDQNKRAHSS